MNHLASKVKEHCVIEGRLPPQLVLFTFRMRNVSTMNVSRLVAEYVSRRSNLLDSLEAILHCNQELRCTSRFRVLSVLEGHIHTGEVLNLPLFGVACQQCTS